ncbi:hypothetical protein ASPSYDRAFT_726076 [Aspergillus sydowii CBS 593.65]|uniref:C2H2-type domain-containing protein n=1 Tax=Aspergillus sydowii CBS 593.65 TaxID=1036612 RepID=A0A1L9SXQ2_9EURO|nr:uncharacterized protein ASPSYDRAFT_726076 [Aspergillus sydowii CBS 593.65]OJJ51964.1 hypothetical protein ASPSYDRAFT_726076 [Aspergillus sydowii CBS 593.65]
MELQLSGILNQSPGINECLFHTTNYPTSDSPTPNSASINNQDFLEASSWHILQSFASHPSRRNTNLPPRSGATSLADMGSTDSVWPSYSNAEYENVSQSMADFITPQSLPPSQFTPMMPLPWCTEYMTTSGAAKPHTATTPGLAYSLGAGSGVSTPMGRLDSKPLSHFSESQHALLYTGPFPQPRHALWRKQTPKPNLSLGYRSPIIKAMEYKCPQPGCHGRFKRQEHVTRHMKSHLNEKPYVCWVPGCHRAFSRGDNLGAHFKTHSKQTGRNRYVSTLDETSPDYDPDFRGQITADGRPVYEFKLEEKRIAEHGHGHLD